MIKYEKKNDDFVMRLRTLIGTDKPFPWAARIGLTPGVIDRMWNKGVAPKADALLAIHEATGVSLDWLLLGKGPMYQEKGAALREATGDTQPDLFVGAARKEAEGHDRPRAKGQAVLDSESDQEITPERGQFDPNLLAIDSWLSEECKDEPDFRSIFFMDFLDRFPEFKEWCQKKRASRHHHAGEQEAAVSAKVA